MPVMAPVVGLFAGSLLVEILASQLTVTPVHNAMPSPTPPFTATKLSTAFAVAPSFGSARRQTFSHRRSRSLRFGRSILWHAQLRVPPSRDEAVPRKQPSHEVLRDVSSSDWVVPAGTSGTLYVVDAFGLLYRSYYALVNAKMSSRGLFDTRAVYGFTTVMLSFLSKHARGSPVAVVFEGRRLTVDQDFRSQLYPEYKAQRAPTPAGVAEAVPWVKRLCAVMGLAVVEVDAFEADDTIGGIVRKARRAGVRAVIVSIDKDFRQLLDTDVVTILRPGIGGFFEQVTEESFRKEFANLHPRQYVDVLTLIGDAADGLRGVPGIGKLTAPRLIAHYGDLENLLAEVRHYYEQEDSEECGACSGGKTPRGKSTTIEELPHVSKRIARNLRDNEQHALLVKRLITIREDVPLGDISWERLQRKSVDVHEAHEVLRVLEFTNRNTTSKILHSADDVLHLRKKDSQLADLGPIVVREHAAKSAKSSTANGVTEHPVRQAKILSWSETDLKSAKWDRGIVEYLQTPSDAEIEIHLQKVHGRFGILGVVSRAEGYDRLIGFALSAAPGSAFYVDLSDGRSLPQYVLRLLEDRHMEKRGWFLKTVYKLLRLQCDVNVRGKLFDNRIASELLHGGERMTDARLASLYLGDGALDPWISGRDHRLTSSFSAQDSLPLCDIALRLSDTLSTHISKTNLSYVLNYVELPLIPVLSTMEISGVPINSDGLRAFESRVRERLAVVECRLKQILPQSDDTEKHFKPSSRDDVARLIFDVWKVDIKVKKTSSGKFPVNKRVLSLLASDDRCDANQRLFAELMLEYRETAKILSTYTKSLLSTVHPDGRIRTTFVQDSAASGRLSTSKPNLQSIPIRSVLGREVRSMVRAPEGFSILCADYSQIELRIIASMSGDESLIAAFRNGVDVHRAVAAKVFVVEDPNDVTEDQRRKAKEVNYGIPYGISSYGLGQQMGISGREAKRLMAQFHEEFPKVKRLTEKLIDDATNSGYAKTLLGRRLTLPLLLHGGPEERKAASRVAVNMPIQGTQADMIKLAMIRIARRLGDAKARSKLIMQVHDELLVEVHDSELEAVKVLVEEEMVSAFPLTGVEIVVNTGCGRSWLDAAHS